MKSQQECNPIIGLWRELFSIVWPPEFWCKWFHREWWAVELSKPSEIQGDLWTKYDYVKKCKKCGLVWYSST